MKILLVSHSGLVTGGAEQCLLEYVGVLVNRGHKCKVLVPYKGAMTKTLTERGILWTVVGYGWAIRPHRNVRAQRIMASTGNSLVRIFQEVGKFKPDLILTNTSVIPWGLYAGRAFNIPNVLLVHEILNDKDPSLNMVPNYHDYAEILNTNTDFVVYNSEFVKSEFADVLTVPKTSKNILYPLPPLDEVKIDQFFNQNVFGNKIKIAIFGAISPRKNQLEALQAAKILHDKGIKNFIIDLYGDSAAIPRYTKELRRYIRTNSLGNNVKIKGYATNVYQKMNEYNVVLSTATYEPFGRTIIEGQLFGRLVITNNTGGGLELVRDNDTGLVYELGNVNQLADRIEWALRNHQRAFEIGARAKKEQFNSFITGSRHEALLEAVDYFDNYQAPSINDNIFNPLISLFQYNQDLNHKYRYLYRLTHNRFTRRIKILVRWVFSGIKKVIRQYV